MYGLFKNQGQCTSNLLKKGFQTFFKGHKAKIWTKIQTILCWESRTKIYLVSPDEKMLSLICLKCFWRRMGKWPMLTFFEALMNENMKNRLLRHLKTVAYRQETWYRFSVWHFVFSKSWRRLFLANRVQFLILISKKLRSSFGLIILDSVFRLIKNYAAISIPIFSKKTNHHRPFLFAFPLALNQNPSVSSTILK